MRRGVNYYCPECGDWDSETHHHVRAQRAGMGRQQNELVRHMDSRLVRRRKKNAPPRQSAE